jgi:hypothetical protein
MRDFPLPGSGKAVVVAPAPAAGPGYWAGAPSAVLDEIRPGSPTRRRCPGSPATKSTPYATSGDGLTWQWHGTVLSGRTGEWDARGARVTTVLPDESHELRTELVTP